MSETATFPFDTSTSPDDAPDGPDRRRLFLFITVGVIAAALGGYFLAVALFGGGDQVTAPTVPPRAAQTPLASGAPSASPAPAPQSFAGAANRDPFVPLVVPPPPAAAPAGAAVAAPPASQPSASASTPGMTTFKVLSVAGSQAVVTIDGVRHTASAGQVFATSYRLVATSNGMCADFTKAGTRFGLCEGQTLVF